MRHPCLLVAHGMAYHGWCGELQAQACTHACLLVAHGMALYGGELQAQGCAHLRLLVAQGMAVHGVEHACGNHDAQSVDSPDSLGPWQGSSFISLVCAVGLESWGGAWAGEGGLLH